MCSNCTNNSTGTGTFELGDFGAAAALTFYFRDDGGGICSLDCDGYYECGSGTTHVAVEKLSDTVYKIYFVDAGCGCERVGQTDPPQAGPGVANIEVTITLTPTP